MYSNKYIQMTGETIIKKNKQSVVKLNTLEKSNVYCLQSILEMIL